MKHEGGSEVGSRRDAACSVSTMQRMVTPRRNIVYTDVLNQKRI